MQKGIARGIFSNEAGLGSAPIAAAAVQTDYPVKQGLVSMLGTVIDTLIICTMTGLAIVLYRYMGHGLGRCCRYNQGIPARTSVPKSGSILYPDGMSGILCIYHNLRMGLLQ